MLSRKWLVITDYVTLRSNLPPSKTGDLRGFEFWTIYPDGKFYGETFMQERKQKF